MIPAVGAFIRGSRRLAFYLRRPQLQRDLTEELEFHRLTKAAENERAGLPPEIGHDLSRRQMGNLTIAKEACRNMWGFLSFEQLLQDVRYALRLFIKSPVFTSVAILSLAVGVGGTAAMFSLVDALLIQPLPYFQPDRLVRITGIYPRAALPFFQEHSRTMDVAAVSASSELNLTGQGEATRLQTSTVSTNLLSVLGIQAERGRVFQPREDAPGRDGVVLITHALWGNRFASDPAIIGRIITLNGVNREIVGVLPERSKYPSAKVQAWIPMREDPANFLEYWGEEFVPFVGRLRAGATLDSAQIEVRALMAQFRKTIPYPMSRDWNANATAIPLQQDLVGDIRGKLLILLACVAVVLLIACVNLAGLLLSRAAARRKEIAIRAALGAARLRVVRQLLTESVALAFCGAALGLLLASIALSIFKSVLPSTTMGLARAAIDWHVAALITGLAVLTGIVFGLAPAISLSQVDVSHVIKTSGQRSTTHTWATLRSVLIGAEIALAFLLVVSAGLLVRSLDKLTESKPGFEASHLLAIRISPTQSACTRRDACVAFYERLLDSARNLSGVMDARL